MKTKIIIGLILVANQARAFDYGDVIRRQQDLTNFNKYYAKAESQMYKERYRKYAKHARNLKKYGEWHSKAMTSDASLTGYEAQMNRHGSRPSKSYISDWAYGETEARLRGAY